MEVKRLAIGLILVMLVTISLSACGPSTETTAGEEVHFRDPNLEAVIREALDKPEGSIYTSDLERLELHSASSKNITDLNGLEKCTTITDLSLSGNKIEDLSPLASLTDMNSLVLDRNQISDVSPLASLTKLTVLGLYENQISDVSPLASLTNLKVLVLNENQVSDISPLASLTSLTRLYLQRNQIADISALSSLTRLDTLDLVGTQITNISPLSSLSNLTELRLDRNQIVDISMLASLTNLTHLYLKNNLIEDIEPLVTNAGLGEGDNVDLADNPLSDTSVNVYIPQLRDRGVDVHWKWDEEPGEGERPSQEGIWNVDTIEEASQITGYPVATPAFIPDGFQRGSRIMVSQLGAGLPEDIERPEFPKNVEQMWTWEEDDSVWFVLIQSPKEFGVGGTEPAEVCGSSGGKGLLEAYHELPARLVLAWNDGKLFYSLCGTLADPLTEEILLQIACSVGVDGD